MIALSSEWFEWYQTIYTDWMTIAGAGVPTVDVSLFNILGGLDVGDDGRRRRA